MQPKLEDREDRTKEQNRDNHHKGARDEELSSLEVGLYTLERHRRGLEIGYHIRCVCWVTGDAPQHRATGLEPFRAHRDQRLSAR